MHFDFRFTLAIADDLVLDERHKTNATINNE